MGQTSDEVIAGWLRAVGKDAKTTGPVRERVVTAGDFLWKTGRLSLPQVADALRGFDFSKPVTVMNHLPDTTYVQYVAKHRGHWFTSTGLTQSACGLAEGFRKRQLFEPSGAVAALKGTAASIRDTWSADKVFRMNEIAAKWPEIVARAEKDKVALTYKHFEAFRKRLGDLAAGGGVQYYVPDLQKMSRM